MAELKIYGEHDEKVLGQMARCMSIGSVTGGVLCADGHYGYAHPIGGVVAYEDHISLSGVGFDIGCGNMAVQLDIKADEIREDLPRLADEISKVISFGVGRKNAARALAGLGENDRFTMCTTHPEGRMTKRWRTIAKGEIDFDQVKGDMRDRSIELRGAGADEAPGAYKRLSEVLDYHAGTIEVCHTLRPLIVVMAGSNEVDPYKD